MNYKSEYVNEASYSVIFSYNICNKKSFKIFLGRGGGDRVMTIYTPAGNPAGNATCKIFLAI